MRVDPFKLLGFIQMQEQKRIAIEGVKTIFVKRAWELPVWWRWTAGLASAITIRRIEAA